MTEQTRQCGYRKIGGLYFVSTPGTPFECESLPINTTICPCCGEGIKQSRGFTWILPSALFNIDCENHTFCPLKLTEKQGLMWVGEKFYTPESFIKEALELGVSKRIGAVPNDFKIGETWIFVAHPKAGIDSEGNQVPAIFYCFKPQRIEKIVTEVEFEDKDEMEKLEKRGIIPFVVDDDEEHKGNVFDAKKPVVVVDTMEKWLR